MAEINRKTLEAEFDLPTFEDEEENQIVTFKEILNEAKQIEDPTNVLTTIIQKAGTFLDLIEAETAKGGMSARYMEIASSLIQAIISASSGIASVNSQKFNDKLKGYSAKQKDIQIKQKDRELDIKENQAKNQGGGTTNNVIVTDRESMLKFLEAEDKKDENIIEHK